jgi:hypothetical protein
LIYSQVHFEFMTLNSCLSLLCAGIIGVNHYDQLIVTSLSYGFILYLSIYWLLLLGQPSCY